MYMYVQYTIILVCSLEDKEFVKKSTEMELVQLFRNHDDLQEQLQEVENKLDEAEDTRLPYAHTHTHTHTHT